MASQQQQQPKKALWATAIDHKGRTYYYNRVTRESRWSLPEEYEKQQEKRNVKAIRLKEQEERFDQEQRAKEKKEKLKEEKLKMRENVRKNNDIKYSNNNDEVTNNNDEVTQQLEALDVENSSKN